MAKFITVMSGKGGVGKTTTAVNTAHHIHHSHGEDVVIVEGNLSSPNLSLHLGQPHFPITLHDVLGKNKKIHKAVYKHETGLHIIPADVGVSSMKLVDFDKFQRSLTELHSMAEYVVIDGSPGLGRESEQLLNATDELLIVTNPDEASIYDAKRLIDFATRKAVPIIGVVLNKYRWWSWYTLSKDEVEKLLGVPIITTVKHDKRFRKSLSKKKPFSHMYPRRQPSKAFRTISSHITNRP